MKLRNYITTNDKDGQELKVQAFQFRNGSLPDGFTYIPPMLSARDPLGQYSTMIYLEKYVLLTPIREGDWIVFSEKRQELFLVQDWEFQKKFRIAEGTLIMDYGEALNSMKQGQRVARIDWHDKGTWLRRLDLYNDKEFGVREYGNANGQTYDSGTLMPAIWMHTADNKFIPWHASQTDQLAEDWVVVE